MFWLVVLKYVLLVVEVLSAILLIGAILLQRSKDQGLGLAFGGGMGETLFGSRVTDVLTKISVTLVAIFLLDTIILARMFSAHIGPISVVRDATPASPASAPASAQPRESPAGPLGGIPSVPFETPIVPVGGAVPAGDAPATPAPSAVTPAPDAASAAPPAPAPGPGAGAAPEKKQ